MQTIIFMGDSRERIQAFPEAARRAVGRQLLRVQHGLDPQDYMPMTSVGAGVREIRIHVDGAFRVFFVTNIGNAIYVLHAFAKKSQKTSRSDLDLGKKRYKEIGE
jgi:phage-related protein